MMMTKPKPEENDSSNVATAAELKKKTATAAVSDLERRLAELGNPATLAPSTSTSTPPTMTTKPVQVPTTTSTSMASTNNKNALLARIMAAQERAKQAQQAKNFQSTTIAPPPSSTATTPASSSTMAAAPPSYDMYSTASLNGIQPPQPPAFDNAFAFMAPPPQSTMQVPTTMTAPPDFHDTFFPAPPSEQQDVFAPPPAYDIPQSFQWDPHAPAPLLAPPVTSLTGLPSSPPSASAPSYDDLMDYQQQQQQQLPWEPMAPPSPPVTSEEDEVMAAILAMDGLSAAEKESLIADQKKIMASIEASKKNEQLSAADAFEQRSLQSAVGALGGRSTAVRSAGTFGGRGPPPSMEIPPEVAAAMTDSELEQLKADMKFAEQLQQEEYENAERENQAARQARRATRTNGTAVASPTRSGTTSSANASTASTSQSWMEWLGLASAPTPNTAAAARREREQMIENDGSTISGGGGSALVVGGNQPLFACVTDSISQAANYALNPSLSQDDEGNVHGVDSSGLLAVPQVGRNQGGNSNDTTSNSPW